MDAIEFTIPVGAAEEAVSARTYPAHRAAAAHTLILAHGAGAPHTHPFMLAAALGLSRRGVTVLTFNFPYMEHRRKLPDRAPVLEATWLDVLAHAASRTDLPGRCFIGGKSMGGRMASHIAVSERRGDLAVVPAGLILLGYPLHPPARPDKRRDAHLQRLACPALFVQGSRDAFGTPEEFAPVIDRADPGVATIHVVEGGDHSFSVPRASGRRRQDVLDAVWDVVAAWIGEIAASVGGTAMPQSPAAHR
jgi:hypothetical protein